MKIPPPFIRVLVVGLFIAIALLSGAHLNAAGANDQRSHFQRADSYTVKVRTSVEYPFIKDRVGSSKGAGFLLNKATGWIATNASGMKKNR